MPHCGASGLTFAQKTVICCETFFDDSTTETTNFICRNWAETCAETMIHSAHHLFIWQKMDVKWCQAKTNIEQLRRKKHMMRFLSISKPINASPTSNRHRCSTVRRGWNAHPAPHSPKPPFCSTKWLPGTEALVASSNCLGVWVPQPLKQNRKLLKLSQTVKSYLSHFCRTTHKNWSEPRRRRCLGSPRCRCHPFLRSVLTGKRQQQKDEKMKESQVLAIFILWSKNVQNKKNKKM